MPNPSSSSSEIPARFRPSQAVLLIDGFMNHAIKLGGILVITAVLGIFVFIALQVYPLFLSAKVSPIAEISLPTDNYTLLTSDEWGQTALLATSSGNLLAVDVPSGTTTPITLQFPIPKPLTCLRYLPEQSLLLAGTADGHISLIPVHFPSSSSNDQNVRNLPKLTPGPWLLVVPDQSPILDIAYFSGFHHHLAAVISGSYDQPQLWALPLEQRQTLLGRGELRPGSPSNLTPLLEGKPTKVLVNKHADAVLVSTSEGKIEFFIFNDGTFSLRQIFQPFPDKPHPALASMDFLFGTASLVLTSHDGTNEIWSLFIPHGASSRQFGKTKDFPPLPTGANAFARSLRNKSFLLASGNTLSLRYGTTADVRFETTFPHSIQLVSFNQKNDRILFLSNDSKLHILSLSDPHPEVNLRALFGKVWYEGQNAPSYEWQSTGGSDDFEPKLSLVPLIIGTLKGTLYAMLFAVPIALTAALYTSQFLHPTIRRIVKPTMEIMASLPSVVLGFLAALWLAPILETAVPSVLCLLVALPLSALLFGAIVSRLPRSIRLYLPDGFEFLWFTPIFLLTAYVAWNLGPTVEKIFFTVHDPGTGQTIADFRRWWPHFTGAPFEQRNSLVVGFMMGFAVIPLIFTISEDALSNVPQALRSASLALGASRWQTARYVVLPTASPGIFSALMIGLGRAVGETMIVVMATGNTPILDFNIFSGMRTLSANIAVELPEAPHNGTLYRTLFLGALVLFLLTFLINTIAELLRQHLRDKFKTV